MSFVVKQEELSWQ